MKNEKVINHSFQDLKICISYVSKYFTIHIPDFCTLIIDLAKKKVKKLKIASSKDYFYFTDFDFLSVEYDNIPLFLLAEILDKSLKKDSSNYYIDNNENIQELYKIFNLLFYHESEFHLRGFHNINSIRNYRIEILLVKNFVFMKNSMFFTEDGKRCSDDVIAICGKIENQLYDEEYFLDYNKMSITNEYFKKNNVNNLLFLYNYWREISNKKIPKNLENYFLDYVSNL